MRKFSFSNRVVEFDNWWNCLSAPCVTSDTILTRSTSMYLLSWNRKLWIRIAYCYTARWTLVQSAVLRSHVVCLSVRPSVCDVGLWSHRLGNSSEIISPFLGCSLSADPNIRGLLQGEESPEVGDRVHDCRCSTQLERLCWGHVAAYCLSSSLKRQQV